MRDVPCCKKLGSLLLGVHLLLLLYSPPEATVLCWGSDYDVTNGGL